MERAICKIVFFIHNVQNLSPEDLNYSFELNYLIITE